MTPPPTNSPETPSERIALVVWYLAHGEGLTTKQVEQITGITRRSALHLMCRISRVLPIYQDDAYVWQVCVLRELEVETEPHDVVLG